MRNHGGMRRHLAILAAAFASILVTTEAQAGPPDTWRLEQVVDGDIGVGGPPAITVDKVTIGDVDGAIEITACCYLDDCTGVNKYRMGWALEEPYEVVHVGDAIRFTLSNELLSGSCQGVDPWIRPGGNDGFPAPVLEQEGVTIQGPNALFTGGGGDFHVDPSNSSHDPTLPRVVTVQDLGSHDGYWHIDFSQKWGLQYEVVFVYREETAAPTTAAATGGSVGATGSGSGSGTGSGTGGGSDGDDGAAASSCSFSPAGGDPIAAVALALLGLAVSRRRRRRAEPVLPIASSDA